MTNELRKSNLSSDYQNSLNQHSIDSALELSPCLWSVKNIFHDSVLDKILERLQTEVKWQPVEMQEYKNRQCIPWEENGLLDELYVEFSKLNFSRFNFKFRTLTIWKDQEGYTIGQHYDNDRVVGAMQIYLNDLPSTLGTWFDGIEIPFVKNTGYIMNNKNKPIHGMKSVVPTDTSRYSLYAYFDLV